MFFASISESLLLEISFVNNGLAKGSGFLSWTPVVFEQLSSEKGVTWGQSSEK
jgi:hypothetical protein